MSSSRRRLVRTPAAGPLDDDDLLCEILLLLPPQPSSLPRASVVCKRWRHVVSNAGFFRCFRLRHRRNPPLLGFFGSDEGISFLPTMEAPNRVPPGRFSLPSGVGEFQRSLGCRHGLVLIHLTKLLQVLVWDPVTGDQRRIALPAPFDECIIINGAVFPAAGDVQHFQVVLTVANDDEKQHRQAIACVYSSQTGLWGNILSTPVSYQYNGFLSSYVNTDDAVLAGDSLYWVIEGNSEDRILQFDLVTQRLDVIRVPMDTRGNRIRVKIMRAEGGGLGVLFVSYSDCTAQLWKRETDCDGVTSWGLGKIILLDKLLSLKSEEKMPLFVLGYGEENNVVFLKTYIGDFMIHLESLKFKKLLEDTKYGSFPQYHPFESVYTAGRCVGDGHDGAELLLNM